MVFLSPPWGGPAYAQQPAFDPYRQLADACGGHGLPEILRASNRILRDPLPTELSAPEAPPEAGGLQEMPSGEAARGIAVFLPRNTDLRLLAAACREVFPWAAIEQATGPGILSVEVERNYLNGNLKAITVYIGRFPPARDAAEHAAALMASSQ